MMSIEDMSFSIVPGLANWTDLTQSEFAQVIFHDVQEWYPTDGAVRCCYTVSTLITIKAEDRVGLYKVGWSKPTNYVTYIMVAEDSKLMSISGHSTSANIGSRESSVLFSAENLPKDDGEFYQFCYLTADGHIRGASTPFKFRRPHEEDLVEVVEEDDDEMMIVRSRTGVVEEKLRKADEENIYLTKRYCGLEEQHKECKQKIDDLEKDVIEFQLTCGDQKKIIKVLEQRLDELFVKLKSATDEEEVTKTQIDNLIKVLQNKTDTIKDLESRVKLTVSEKDYMTGELKSLNAEKDLLEKHILSDEERLRSYQITVEKWKKDVAKREARENEMVDRLTRLESTLKNECQKRETVEKNLTVATEEKTHAMTRATDLRHMLDASESSKVMVLNELRTLDEFKTKLTADLEASGSEAFRCKQENLKINKQMSRMKTELELYKRENSELKSDIISARKLADHREDDLVRLRSEHRDLNDQFAKLNKRCDTLKSTKESQEQQIESLQEKVREGASQYQAKYMACFRLQKKLAKLTLQYENLEERLEKTEKLKACRSISSLSGGSLTPGQQILSAAMSRSSSQKSNIDQGARQQSIGSEFSLLDDSLPGRESDSGLMEPLKSELIAESSTNVSKTVVDVEQMPTFSRDGNADEQQDRFPSIVGFSSLHSDNGNVECPVCSAEYPAVDDMQQLFDHLTLSHNCKICPVCGQVFDSNQSTEYFNFHVENHFSDEMN